MDGSSDPAGDMIAEHFAIKQIRKLRSHVQTQHRAYWTHLVDARAAWWYTTVTLLCAWLTTSPVPDRAYDAAHLVFLVASVLYVATVVFTAGEASRRGTTMASAIGSAVVVFLWFGVAGLVLVFFFVKDWYTPTPNDNEYFGVALSLGFISCMECLRRAFFAKPETVAAKPAAS